MLWENIIEIFKASQTILLTLDNTVLKCSLKSCFDLRLIWKNITTFFKPRVSIILRSFQVNSLMNEYPGVIAVGPYQILREVSKKLVIFMQILKCK